MLRHNYTNIKIQGQMDAQTHIARHIHDCIIVYTCMCTHINLEAPDLTRKGFKKTIIFTLKMTLECTN